MSMGKRDARAVVGEKRLSASLQSGVAIIAKITNQIGDVRFQIDRRILGQQIAILPRLVKIRSFDHQVALPAGVVADPLREILDKRAALNYDRA
jgi:hypothetical protein